MGGEAFVIAYDVGTTSLKSCLFAIGSDIRLIGAEMAHYELTILPGGGAEQDPEDWWRAMAATTRALLEGTGVDPAAVAGLSFCSQMQGLVLVDEGGVPVRPMMSYMDQRAGKERREGISHGLQVEGMNVFKLLRSLYETGAVAASVKDPVWKYKWVEKHEPERFRRVHKWLDVKEWLLHRCTGVFAMTEDSAFATLLYGIRRGRRGWSRALCRLFGVNMDHLPEVISASDRVGGLTEGAAAQLGLAPGTPVYAGGGDASLVGVGAGATELHDTHVYMGTSGWVSTVVDRSVVDTNAMIAAIVGARPGLYNYFAELETAGKCLEWVRDHLALDEIGVYLEKVAVHEVASEVAVASASEARYAAVPGSASVPGSAPVPGSALASDSGGVSPPGSASDSGGVSPPGSASDSDTVSRLGSASDSGTVSPLGSASNSGTVSPLGSASNSGTVSPLGSASDSGGVSPPGPASDSGTVSPLGPASDSGGVSPPGSASDSGGISPPGPAFDSGGVSPPGSAFDSGTVSSPDAASDSGPASTTAGAALAPTASTAGPSPGTSPITGSAGGTASGSRSESEAAVYVSLYDYLSEVIARVPPGSGGVVFTPWLHGNRCPFEDPMARGMFFNISLDTGKTELIRAVVEGVCFHMRWMLDAQEKKVKTSRVVRFVGGGALSRTTGQILADVLQREVETVDHPQNAGAVGAAAVAAVGLGLIPSLADMKRFIPVERTYRPNSDTRAVYDRNYEVFRRLYRDNKGSFARLNG